MPRSLRRLEREGESSLDSFRCGIALWVALLVSIGATALVMDRGAKAIVVGDMLLPAIVVVFAALVFAEIRPLFETIGSWRTILWTALALAGIAAFMALYVAVAKWIGFRYVSMDDEYAVTGWPLWGILVSAAVIPGIFEEIAFRGVIQTGMERLMSPRDAWIVQAAMFSVLHISPAVFVSHFVIGLVLGQLRRQTGSIYPGMLVHAAWNALVVIRD